METIESEMCNIKSKQHTQQQRRCLRTHCNLIGLNIQTTIKPQCTLNSVSHVDLWAVDLLSACGSTQTPHEHKSTLVEEFEVSPPYPLYMQVELFSYPNFFWKVHSTITFLSADTLQSLSLNIQTTHQTTVYFEQCRYVYSHTWTFGLSTCCLHVVAHRHHMNTSQLWSRSLRCRHPIPYICRSNFFHIPTFFGKSTSVGWRPLFNLFGYQIVLLSSPPAADSPRMCFSWFSQFFN
ncbi:hypothetical protein T4A_13398, partial [Trichinella pseudospiralis]